MKKVKILLILSVFCNACSSESDAVKTNKYFDLKRLIEKQITLLQNQKPLVQKTIFIAEKSENQQVKAIDWSKELELFNQADLNKPAYVSSYNVDSSGMGVKYILKNTENLPVKFLAIQRAGEDGISVEALMSSENYLYQSEKHLKLTLRNNEMLDYQIDGFQKVIFGDKKPFKIDGKIVR
jgi:hypothetical protein